MSRKTRKEEQKDETGPAERHDRTSRMSRKTRQDKQKGKTGPAER